MGLAVTGIPHRPGVGVGPGVVGVAMSHSQANVKPAAV